MLTLDVIFVTLEKHFETLLTTLNSDEKHRFINFLSEIDPAQDDEIREDRVDALFDFCMGFPLLKEPFGSFIEAGNISEKGRQIFEPIEKEQVYLIRNRLIKATKDALNDDAKQKDTQDEQKKTSTQQ
ncbi:MAG: hypothetical protein GY807_17485 [Gammaproteobacteria bacterium]|nr:hypothetical protein [Gammaproteobacteria bacterium]